MNEVKVSHTEEKSCDKDQTGLMISLNSAAGYYFNQGMISTLIKGWNFKLKLGPVSNNLQVSANDTWCQHAFLKIYT